MKQLVISLRMLLVMTVLTGVIYPLAVTGVGNILFSHNVAGSLLEGGQGSELIAQKFVAPENFWARPSSIDYNPQPSGASQLSLSSTAFREAFSARIKEGKTGSLLTTSGSGLDPHISPQSALDQVSRIAKARGLDPEQSQKLQDLVVASIEDRQFGILGEEKVNVNRLNIKLNAQFIGEKK